MKEGFVTKCQTSSPDEKEMELINNYTRREYSPDEVYVFSLVLCDNEIDRDYERFSVSALEKLAELFKGKTCILDHERKSANQTARIFSTWLEREEGRVTKSGEVYTRLAARAYLPRTDRTKETIELIESGILKEVSVSCSVKRTVCGVCGKESCSHKKGERYGDKLCCRVLEDPADAYECSFVAVPAQREAGVRKGVKFGGETVFEKINAPAGGLSLTETEAAELKSFIDDLKEKAQLGEESRKQMIDELLKLSGLIHPEAPMSVIKTAFEKLSVNELSELTKAYRSMAGKRYPLEIQLMPAGKGKKENAANGEYQI